MEKYEETIIVLNNSNISLIETLIIENSINCALVEEKNKVFLYCYNIKKDFLLLLDNNKINYYIKDTHTVHENEYLDHHYIENLIETQKYALHINKQFPKQYNKQNIFIKQKYSFGNGSHITTRLMIENIEKYDFTNKAILDIGTGTGILSIIAEKQNAKISIGIDIDEKSIYAMSENAYLNNCKNTFFIIGDINIVKSQFDIVFINILFSKIKNLIPEIKNLLHQSSLIFVSGIYKNNNEEFLKTIDKYYKIKRSEKSENWYFYLLEY